MIIREAMVSDIAGIQIVRNAVKENTLSNPALVSDADCETFIMQRGKGWVCEMLNDITAFAIADLQDNNIWALFVLPECEHMGIGKQLMDTMLGWYFSQTRQPVWLGTSPRTRAEVFYKKYGWTLNGMHGSNEVKFEMTYEGWLNVSKKITT